MKEGTDAGDHRVPGWRIFLLRLGLWRRCFSRLWRRCGWRILRNDRSVFHASLKNECWSNAGAAHESNELGIEIVGLYFCAGIIGKRRHEDLIDGLVCLRR